MTKLEQLWNMAKDDLGLDIEISFPLVLPKKNITITSELLLKNFGAERGMLVFTRSQELQGSGEEIVQEGYGYSVLSEPSQTRTYKKDEFIALLSDWGWSGPPEKKPTWIKDLPNSE